MARKQTRRGVSMSRDHYRKLGMLAEQENMVKAKVIEALIDGACAGRISIKAAAGAIIAAHDNDAE